MTFLLWMLLCLFLMLLGSFLTLIGLYAAMKYMEKK